MNLEDVWEKTLLRAYSFLLLGKTLKDCGDGTGMLNGKYERCQARYLGQRTTQ